MLKTTIKLAIILACLLGLQLNVAHATDLIETDSFDISDDQNNPTLWELTAGTNLLIATTGGGTGGASNGSDAEFIGVTVPAGLTLDSITLNAYEHIFSTNRVFIAYESGSTTLQAPINDYLIGAAPEPANTLYGVTELGTDIFTNLGSGPFAFWIQETNPEPATYELSFNVVPEPGMAVLLLPVVLAFAFGRRKFL